MDVGRNGWECRYAPRAFHGLHVNGGPIFGGWPIRWKEDVMIRKLASGGYRLYSRKKDPRTGKRKNLGTFKSRAAAEKHEREVQYFKRH
jgi:hypothetical protein